MCNEFSMQGPKHRIEIRYIQANTVCVCVRAGKCTEHRMGKALRMDWEGDKLRALRYADLRHLRKSSVTEELGGSGATT